MIQPMKKRLGGARTPRKTNYRTENPPLCPVHQVPCRCERTKTEGGYKTQYRYCPICGHPEQVVTQIEK